MTARVPDGEQPAGGVTHEAYDDQGELIGQITVPLREVDGRLLWLLRRAGEEWGPLGVALAAAQLTDPAAVVARLTTSPRSRPAEPTVDGLAELEALRAENAELRAMVARIEAAIRQNRNLIGSAVAREFRRALDGA